MAITPNETMGSKEGTPKTPAATPKGKAPFLRNKGRPHESATLWQRCFMSYVGPIVDFYKEEELSIDQFT